MQIPDCVCFRTVGNKICRKQGKTMVLVIMQQGMMPVNGQGIRIQGNRILIV